MKKTSLNIITFFEGDDDNFHYVFDDNVGLNRICTDVVRRRASAGLYGRKPSNEIVISPESVLSSLELEYYNLTDEEIADPDNPHSGTRRSHAQWKYKNALQEAAAIAKFWEDITTVISMSDEELDALEIPANGGDAMPLSLSILDARAWNVNEDYSISWDVDYYPTTRLPDAPVSGEYAEN